MFVILFVLNRVCGLNQNLLTYTQNLVEYPPSPPHLPSVAD